MKILNLPAYIINSTINALMMTSGNNSIPIGQLLSETYNKSIRAAFIVLASLLFISDFITCMNKNQVPIALKIPDPGLAYSILVQSFLFGSPFIVHLNYLLFSYLIINSLPRILHKKALIIGPDQSSIAYIYFTFIKWKGLIPKSYNKWY